MFEEFRRGQFTALVLQRYRPATVERYGRLYESDLREVLGRIQLNAIAPESRALHVRVLERSADPRPQLALLRTVLREAYELELIDKASRLPPLPPKPKTVPAAPPLEVVQQVLEGSTGWLRIAIALAVFGQPAQRRGAALRMMYVDFDGILINVRKAFGGRGRDAEVWRRARGSTGRAASGHRCRSGLREEAHRPAHRERRW